MISRLRIIAAYSSLALCILFVDLWARSHTGGDCFTFNRGTSSCFLSSSSGVVYVQWIAAPNEEGLTWTIDYRWIADPQNPAGSNKFGFRFKYSEFLIGAKPYQIRVGPRIWTIASPYWFKVLVFGLLALAIRPKPRLRFSLRHVFVITTFFAVTLWIALTVGTKPLSPFANLLITTLVSRLGSVQL